MAFFVLKSQDHLSKNFDCSVLSEKGTEIYLF